MRVAPLGASGGVAADRSEPYQGLLDWPFAFSTARVAATTLALGGLIFLATPRRTSMGSSQSTGLTGKHLTGFDDEIKLGELGEILENDSPVMSVELVDLDGVRLGPPTPTPKYRWARREHGLVRLRTLVSHQAQGHRLHLRVVRTLAEEPDRSSSCDQALEPTDNPVLFGLRPVLDVDAPDKRFQPILNETDGSLFRADPRSISFDYSIDSYSPGDIPQPGEHYPSTDYLKRLTAIPEALKRKLRPIAATAQIQERCPRAISRSRRRPLERYLRDSGEFQYSLQMERSDSDLDPVEDFLTNRKLGHCEYFASALALLLRSVDIPARMVNGFKGGNYNAIAKITTVRQKHAHSWVEALVDRSPEPDRLPLWVTLDPTPPDQRNESVARVGGLANNFYQVTDFVRYVWIFYIVGFEFGSAGSLPLRADPLMLISPRPVPRGSRDHGRDHPEVAALPQRRELLQPPRFPRQLRVDPAARRDDPPGNLAREAADPPLLRGRGPRIRRAWRASSSYRRLLRLLAEYGAGTAARRDPPGIRQESRHLPLRPRFRDRGRRRRAVARRRRLLPNPVRRADDP